MTPYERVFAAMTEADIRFVVVGGVAVVLHGHPRMTADLDLVVDLEAEPARRAMAVLTDLGLEPRLPVPAESFADEDTRRAWIQDRHMQVFTMADPKDALFEVDVFAQSPLPFDELWRDAVEIHVGEVVVRVASIEHLVELKRQAGRPQDLADIAALEDLRSDER